jgi:hypothetical protein
MSSYSSRQLFNLVDEVANLRAADLADLEVAMDTDLEETSKRVQSP